MPFRFKLQNVLQWVEMKERAKKSEISSVSFQIRQLQQKKGELERNVDSLLADKAKVSDTRWVPYYGDKLPLDIAELKATSGKIREKKTNLDAKKEELATIVREKKGLESLKEKRFREHRMEEGRHQQKQMDELHRLAKLRK